MNNLVVNLALADGKENPNHRDEEQRPNGQTTLRKNYSEMLVLSKRGLVKDKPDECSKPT
jgi:hypothetical protein